jgi:hypothetical protein
VWPGSRLEVGIAYREDGFSGNDVVGFARLRIPFFEASETDGHSVQQRLMTERVYRSPFTVTSRIEQAAVAPPAPPPGTLEAVYDAEFDDAFNSGDGSDGAGFLGEIENIYFVSGTGGGDGTVNNPFNLQQAAAAAGSNDVFILLGGGGDITGGESFGSALPASLESGLIVSGGGTAITFRGVDTDDSRTFEPWTYAGLTQASARPTVSVPNMTTGVSFNGVDIGRMVGFDVGVTPGPGIGAAIQNAERISVRDLNIATGGETQGLYVLNVQDSSFSDIEINGMAGADTEHGISILSSDILRPTVNLDFSDISIGGFGGYGVWIRGGILANSSIRTEDLTFTNVTITGDSSDPGVNGIRTGYVDDVTFTSTSISNVNVGIAVEDERDTGDPIDLRAGSNVTFNDTNLANIGLIGLRVALSETVTFDGVSLDNSASGAEATFAEIIASDNVTIDGTANGGSGVVNGVFSGIRSNTFSDDIVIQNLDIESTGSVMGSGAGATGGFGLFFFPTAVTNQLPNDGEANIAVSGVSLVGFSAGGAYFQGDTVHAGTGASVNADLDNVSIQAAGADAGVAPAFARGVYAGSFGTFSFDNVGVDGNTGGSGGSYGTGFQFEGHPNPTFAASAEGNGNTTSSVTTACSVGGTAGNYDVNAFSVNGGAC